MWVREEEGGEPADRRKCKCKCKNQKLGLNLITGLNKSFAVDTAFPNSLCGDLSNEMQNLPALELQHNRYAQD